MSQVYKWYMEQTITGRVLLAVAALMLVYFILTKLIYAPWKNQLANLQDEVETKAIDVAWMETQLKKHRSVLQSAIQKKDNNSRSTGGRSFISIIERSAKQNKIYSSIERISPDKADRVQVWINNANFEQWLKWIEKLKGQGVDVYNVRINQLSPNEKVTMVATFQSANSN